MSNDNIRVNWRAAIIPPQHERPLYGRLAWVGRRRALVKMEHNLPVGLSCRLVLMLPKKAPDEVGQFVDGSCVVKHAILNGEYFCIELHWQNIAGDGNRLLEEQIRHYHGMWKGAA